MSFKNRITLSDTPYQSQAPIRASETKGASQQWYHMIGAKYATLTARSHARLIVYSDVVT